MVTLDEIQSVYNMIAVTGVLVAASYYMITLQNTENIRRRDLIFQTLQVPMQQHYYIICTVIKMTSPEQI